MGASEASVNKGNYKSSDEKPPEILAPVEVEILFCASEASAKKIVMESGYFGGKRSLVFAPKKNPASDKLKPEG